MYGSLIGLAYVNHKLQQTLWMFRLQEYSETLQGLKAQIHSSIALSTVNYFLLSFWLRFDTTLEYQLQEKLKGILYYCTWDTGLKYSVARGETW
jgi:hypothetical protein